jgi:hypothetical protein
MKRILVTGASGMLGSSLAIELSRSHNVFATGNSKMSFPVNYKIFDNSFLIQEKDKIIQDVLMKIIPDSRKDFGSYRGYYTFGVKKEITNDVINEVRKCYALLTIEKNFIPIVRHQLYKPDGIMAKKIARNTMVGKN